MKPGKFLWANFYSICNHNVPIPSTIASMSLFLHASLSILTIFIHTHTKKILFDDVNVQLKSS